MRAARAEKAGMTAVLTRVPRVVLLALVVVLATATLTLAANSTVPSAPASQPEPAAAPEPLVVPDVRRQAYVFAKGTLEQAGFAWKVQGAVQGYSANVVATQTPAPGSKVVAKGAPIVVLTLTRNTTYAEEGTPENESPYAGTPARLVGEKPAPAKTKAVARPAAAAPKPLNAPKPAKAAAKPKAAPKRAPAFVVPGAPAEPQDEIALDERARQLAAWLAKGPKPTNENVEHWLFQHNWIVTGASYGWSNGAEALRILVEVDREVFRLWGIGERSEQLARRTLRDVEERSR